MTETGEYFIWSLILLIMVLNVISSIRLIKHFRDDGKKIFLNLVLILFVPVFWSLLVILITKKPKESRLTSRYRYMESGYKNWTRYN